MLPSPPWYSSRSPVRSSFTQMSRRSHPLSQLSGQGGPLYRPAPAPLLWPTHLPRPPNPTLSQQQLLGAAKKFKLRTTNWSSIRNNQTTRQPRYIWQEWQKLRLCWVGKKFGHKIGQHARTWGTYPRTPTDTKSLRSRYRGYYLTNRPLHLDQQAWPYGDQQQQDHPIWKPPRQWRFAASRNPTTLDVLPPDIRISSFVPSSTMPPRWRWQHRPTREYGQPPQGLSQSIHWRAIWCLPSFGAPKSWISPGWRNQWEW